MQTRIRRRRRGWLVPVGIIAAAAILIGVVIAQWTGGGEDAPGTAAENTTTAQQDAPTQPSLRDLERRDPDDLLTMGPVDAPVALVVYSDYQCQYCAKWSNDTLPELIPYADEGRLRIEWRDVNIFGPASERASLAAYAAAMQDQYWAYHDALYPDGGIRPESQLSEAALVELAIDLGLDGEQFAGDMASQTAATEIARNAQEGSQIGVTGTPAFILHGIPLVGAQPTQVFVDALEDALAEAEG